MGIVSEFRQFALRGSVVDLAVGVIIGAAFTRIVDSLVSDVLLPPLNLLTGEVDFTQLYLALGGDGGYTSADTAREAGAAVIAYGAFLNALLQFLLLALAVFLMVRAINRLRREPEAAAPTRQCPFCISAIDAAAVRCPYCTSELGGRAEAEA